MEFGNLCLEFLKSDDDIILLDNNQNTKIMILPKKRSINEISNSDILHKEKYQRFSNERQYNRQLLDRFIYLILLKLDVNNDDLFTKYAILNLARALECLLYPNRRQKDMFSFRYAKIKNLDVLSRNILYKDIRGELDHMIDTTYISLDTFFQEFICKLINDILPVNFTNWSHRNTNLIISVTERMIEENEIKNTIVASQKQIVNLFDSLLSKEKVVGELIRQFTKNIKIVDLKFRFK
jgi:hypothetical protein